MTEIQASVDRLNTFLADYLKDQPLPWGVLAAWEQIQTAIEKEHMARMDTMGEAPDSRTAPTNEAVEQELWIERAKHEATRASLDGCTRKVVELAARLRAVPDTSRRSEDV